MYWNLQYLITKISDTIPCFLPLGVYCWQKKELFCFITKDNDTQNLIQIVYNYDHHYEKGFHLSHEDIFCGWMASSSCLHEMSLEDCFILFVSWFGWFMVGANRILHCMPWQGSWFLVCLQWGTIRHKHTDKYTKVRVVLKK